LDSEFAGQPLATDHFRAEEMSSAMLYCASPYAYQRRRSREITIGDPAHGGVLMGGDHSVVVQSMLTCDTMDTAECVKQTLELVEVGCQIVRITAPTVKDAANLQNIVAELRKRGCLVPIVADIHFKPEAAMEAVKWVEVVRVNPGNYADSKKFAIKEYTDAQYAAELKRIEEKFAPLVIEAKKLKRCLRIGTNHGSLSDRIMNRYGDTPLGMVESALEFARICRQHEFHNFKFDEVVQSESDDRVLSPARRTAGAGGAGLELPDSPRRHRSRRRRRWPD
jgi:(E)-4-hydroxy-3-methylbut-2-enyl-diphosphate synthase